MLILILAPSLLTSSQTCNFYCQHKPQYQVFIATYTFPSNITIYSPQFIRPIEMIFQVIIKVNAWMCLYMEDICYALTKFVGGKNCMSKSNIICLKGRL